MEHFIGLPQHLHGAQMVTPFISMSQRTVGAARRKAYFSSEPVTALYCRIFQKEWTRNDKTTSRRTVECPTLFPLDRARRFAGDVEADAVDAFAFVDDPRRETRQQGVRQMHPVGGHAIHAF